MAYQYSVTVSEESDRILRRLKKSEYMTSQVIDEAIRTLGEHALARLMSIRRQVEE